MVDKTLANKIMNLKGNIEQKNNSKKQLEIEKEYLLKELKEEFNFTTIKEAEENLQKLESKLSKQKKELTELLEEVETKYEKL